MAHRPSASNHHHLLPRRLPSPPPCPLCDHHPPSLSKRGRDPASPCCCCPMPTALAAVRPEDCRECVQTCEDEHCAIQLTEQCTDQCVVVACDDPHDEPLDPSLDPLCDAPCTDEHCTTLDEFFQCCIPQYTGFNNGRAAYDVATGSHPWDHSLDALLATAAQQSYHQHAPIFPSDNAQLIGTSSHSSSPSSFSTTPNTYPSSPTFDAVSQAHTTPVSPALSSVEQPPLSVLPLKCMWGDCAATFASMSDLVGHVNLQHLRLPPTTVSAPQPQVAPSASLPDALSCLWADCQVYPTPSSVPGPSTGNTTDNALGVLASHLLQDHLGLPTASTAVTPKKPVVARSSPSVASTITAATSPTAPSIAGPPTPGPEHDCSAPNAHVCKWESCGQSFASCDALTKHITETHVGSGKAHYECFWEGCKRNGDSGFASKQKICRHLQSHTGHRPFQCQVCQQNFSEAATLAQHMRRHTQEKPYTCDFPGCGKSFAITGALTIHKRTHNGHKPFKCSYCDRAFAESSNLSKHLRTHTGVRPYPCTHPSCSKSFARPDQLARHMAVHKKNEANAAAKGADEVKGGVVAGEGEVAV